MPTGHTAPILDGDITTVAEFARECMGSFIRDGIHAADPNESTIKFHREALAAANVNLIQWNSMDEEGRYRAWSESYETNRHIAQAAKDTAQRNSQRLCDMKYLVKSIFVPVNDTDLIKFQDFMIQQINATISLDGSHDPDSYRHDDFFTWCDNQASNYLDDIQYHAREWRYAIDRLNENQSWRNKIIKTYGIEV